jgi:hypothetical protein
VTTTLEATYLRLLLDKFGSSVWFDRDLIARALSELAEIERPRDLLVACSAHKRAWRVDYDPAVYADLLYWARLGDHEQFVRTAAAAAGAAECAWQHEWDLSPYSQALIM